MAGLKVHAFSGLRARSGKEPGWSKGGTNAAFIVSVLRYFYGDQFDYNALQEFKQLNMIEDWEPREDLLGDGTLVGQGDGVIYFPDGFDSSGWDQLYSKWKSGQSVATLPAEPQAVIETPAEIIVEDPAEQVDEWSFETSPTSAAINSTSAPAPSIVPDLPQPQPQLTPQLTPPPGAPQAIAQPSQMPTPPQPGPQPGAAKKTNDSLIPLLALAGGGLALLLLAGKKKK